MDHKRALLVGIDAYENVSNLGGCVNDVDALCPLLARNDDGSPNFDCQTRTTRSGAVTRDSLLVAVDELLAPGADVALLYFAGHGTSQGTDVALVASNGTVATPGVAFSEVLSKVRGSSVGEVIVILDCCFAGAAGGLPQLDGATAVMRSGVSILAASRGDQTSAESDAGRGAFSGFLEGALEGGAAEVLGRVTMAGVYAYLDESFGSWEQRPSFKANVDRLHELRRCAPAVSPEDLRRVSEFFPTAGYVLPLDPSYEPELEPRNDANEAVFRGRTVCCTALVSAADCGESSRRPMSES